MEQISDNAWVHKLAVHYENYEEPKARAQIHLLGRVWVEAPKFGVELAKVLNACTQISIL